MYKLTSILNHSKIELFHPNVIQNRVAIVVLFIVKLMSVDGYWTLFELVFLENISRNFLENNG